MRNVNLIELAIITTIIGILLAIVMPKYTATSKAVTQGIVEAFPGSGTMETMPTE